mmetsp:Transcript_47261/g.119716  ORF Transcript_47261/g.119716 Transcript_47261/m.119716 type:complete len:109 (+) Transcript_47261:156-482(+)
MYIGYSMRRVLVSGDAMSVLAASLRNVGIVHRHSAWRFGFAKYQLLGSMFRRFALTLQDGAWRAYLLQRRCPRACSAGRLGFRIAICCCVRSDCWICDVRARRVAKPL